MKQVITSILTDVNARTDTNIEATFMHQAVASPWLNVAES